MGRRWHHQCSESLESKQNDDPKGDTPPLKEETADLKRCFLRSKLTGNVPITGSDAQFVPADDDINLKQ